MNIWSELHIGIIYYTGLVISLLAIICVITYLKQIKSVFKKITTGPGIWSSSFRVTVFLSGLLGAMSVSFRDCKGKYEYLLESKHETVMKGLEQVSVSFQWIAFILIFWFFLLIALWMISKRKRNSEFH